VRSADWLLTEYNNQNDPSSFFSVGEEGAGCSYSYRKSITIQSSQVSGTADHSNFPVLVNLTNGKLRHIDSGGHVTNTNGYDIIFRASDETTQLDHEIEEYDSSTGTVVAWVRIPTLSYDTNTVIYMYYGNTCISTSQENVTGVWDSNYLGVWHLKESGDGTVDEFKDSTTMDKGVKVLLVWFLHSQHQGRSLTHRILMEVPVSVSPTLLAYNQLQLSRFLGGLNSEPLVQAVR